MTLPSDEPRPHDCILDRYFDTAEWMEAHVRDTRDDEPYGCTHHPNDPDCMCEEDNDD